ELGPEDLAEVREADVLALDRQVDVVLLAWDQEARHAAIVARVKASRSIRREPTPGARRLSPSVRAAASAGARRVGPRRGAGCTRVRRRRWRAAASARHATCRPVRRTPRGIADALQRSR